MAGETKQTPGPWGWQKFGKEWCLTGQHSMRPIVLSVMSGGPRRGTLTSLVDGLLQPFDPKHPDALLMAAAPELLEVLVDLLNCAAFGAIPKRVWDHAIAVRVRAEGRAS